MSEYSPAWSERWKWDDDNPRHLYRTHAGDRQGEYVGTVETPELAMFIVQSVNKRLGALEAAGD